jgi:peptidoglycan/xylan/chitin deacetylase (PgdA/CDA1 family)
VLLLSSLQADHLIRIHGDASNAPICRVVTDRKAIALTFDDGPDPAYTPQVISLLEAWGDHATFFLTGAHAEANPALVSMELRAGMEVGDHTWSHPHLMTLSEPQAIAQITRARALLSSDGASVGFFRAPFGEASPSTLAAVRGIGMTTIHWSIPLDHYVDLPGSSPQEAAAGFLADLRPGDIVLAHDARDGGIGRAAAVATLRLVLPILRRRGFDVTTVGSLLEEGPMIRAEPRPWFWQSGFSCPAR